MKYYSLTLFIIAIILVYIIFQWTHYLVINGYIRLEKPLHELFKNTTSHTIDPPLNTFYECKNKCMVGRCSATGQQCLADIDCPGCKAPWPLKRPYRHAPILFNTFNGKSTSAMAPFQSTLTNDFSSNAYVFNKTPLPLSKNKYTLFKYDNPYPANL